MLRAREAGESCRCAGVPRPFAERSSKGEHRPRQETPHGCRPAFHSERAVGETDSTKRRFVPLPTAIDPARCHAWCYASRAKARCRDHIDLTEISYPKSPWRRKSGSRPRIRRCLGRFLVPITAYFVSQNGVSVAGKTLAPNDLLVFH